MNLLGNFFNQYCSLNHQMTAENWFIETCSLPYSCFHGASRHWAISSNVSQLVPVQCINIPHRKQTQLLHAAAFVHKLLQPPKQLGKDSGLSGLPFLCTAMSHWGTERPSTALAWGMATGRQPLGPGAVLYEAWAGAAPGITFSKLTFWMKGPARLWCCESNHNFPLDVENYLMALKILLLSSKVGKIDILCQGRCFFFPSGDVICAF